MNLDTWNSTKNSFFRINQSLITAKNHPNFENKDLGLASCKILWSLIAFEVWDPKPGFGQFGPKRKDLSPLSPEPYFCNFHQKGIFYPELLNSMKSSSLKKHMLTLGSLTQKLVLVTWVYEPCSSFHQQNLFN